MMPQMFNGICQDLHNCFIGKKDMHRLLRKPEAKHKEFEHLMEFGENTKKSALLTLWGQGFSADFKTKTLTFIFSFNIEHNMGKLMTVRLSKYKLSS